MRIGLDFDNTIVCYDQAIALLADELFQLPEELPRTKLALRDFLRARGREQEWTAFQGELYGPGMRYAKPFEGAIQAMQHLVSEGHRLVIVSHRSLKPYEGRPHDLHAAAKNWVRKHLQNVGLFRNDRHDVNFLETREAKLNHISKLGCNAFVDDLPEIFQSPDFQDKIYGILFDPSGAEKAPQRCISITSWHELSEIVSKLH
jgi:hypothetical protein